MWEKVRKGDVGGEEEDGGERQKKYNARQMLEEMKRREKRQEIIDQVSEGAATAGAGFGFDPGLFPC